MNNDIFEKVENACLIRQRVLDYRRCRIAFSGKMGAGKSTLAKMIKDYFKEQDCDFKIFSFATGVKKVAIDFFNMDPEKKNRELLIQIGNKMREIDPDVWAKRVISEVGELDFCLVDDLRYQNEARYLKKAGFTLIKLRISHELQEKRLRETYPETWEKHLEFQNHFTEQGLVDDLFDYILDVNDGRE